MGHFRRMGGGRVAHLTVVGSANTDMALQLSHLPQPGETVLGGRFTTAGGGKVANQAVAAAVGALTVTCLGAQPALPSRAQVMHFLKEARAHG